MQTRHDGLYPLILRCETNGTSAPDGAEPGSEFITWARSAAGTLTATIAGGYKPDRILSGRAYFEESDGDIDVKYGGYNFSTGAVTVYTKQEACYLLNLQAEANGTSAPDGPVPSSGVTWARTSEGLFTATITAASRPTYVHAGWASVMENNVSANLDFVSYADGIVTFISHDDDGTSGVPELEDLDDVTFSVTLLCSNNSATPTLTPGTDQSNWITADTTNKTLVLELWCT